MALFEKWFRDCDSRRSRTRISRWKHQTKSGDSWNKFTICESQVFAWRSQRTGKRSWPENSYRKLCLLLNVSFLEGYKLLIVCLQSAWTHHLSVSRSALGSSLRTSQWEDGTSQVLSVEGLQCKLCLESSFLLCYLAFHKILLQNFYLRPPDQPYY